MGSKVSFCCMGAHCNFSCCGAFSGFADKLYSVEKRSFKDIILTPQDVSRLQGSIYEQYVLVGEDDIGRIRTDERGVCDAYQEGRCIINDYKPTICKCFPLYLDAFVGLCAFRGCPATNENYTVENYTGEIESLLSLYEFWISYYKKLLKCT